MFAKSTDAFVVEQMRMHFGIITGLSEPIVKPKGKPKKNDDAVIPFSEFSFLNLMAFRFAFMEAQKRGLVNPVEIAQGNEILTIIASA